MTTVNVTAIVVGKSQEGKSTLVSTLTGIPSCNQDNPDPDGVPIGNGHVRCSIEPRWYNNIVPATKWGFECEDISVKGELRTNQNKKQYDKISKKSRSFENFLSNNDSIVCTNERTGEEGFNVKLFDTPGLDDSSNKSDEAIMADVLLALSDKEYLNLDINALIFVTSFGSAYSKSFQEQYLLYTGCFPELATNIIVVHTHFNAGLRRANERTEGKTIEERIKSFETHVSKVPGTKHVFIDSKPEDVDTFRYRMYRLGLDVQCLLDTLSEMPAKNIGSIRYFKTADFKSVDRAIKEKINGTLNTNVKEIKGIETEYRNITQIHRYKVVQLEKEKEQMERLVVSKNVQINNIDTSIPEYIDRISVDIDTSEAVFTYDFSYKSSYVSEKFPIYEVKKPRLKSDNTINEKWTVGSYNYNFTIKSEFFGPAMRATIEFYTRSKDKHQDLISSYREELQYQEEKLQSIDTEKGIIEDEIRTSNTKSVDEVRRIQKNNDVLYKILEEINCDHIPVRKFVKLYAKYDKHEIDNIINEYKTMLTH